MTSLIVIFGEVIPKAYGINNPVKQRVCLQENNTLEELINKSVKIGHSRFPVYMENKADIVGMVHVKDALLKDKNMPVKEIMREIIKIPTKMKIEEIFGEIRDEHDIKGSNE